MINKIRNNINNDNKYKINRSVYKNRSVMLVYDNLVAIFNAIGPYTITYTTVPIYICIYVYIIKRIKRETNLFFCNIKKEQPLKNPNRHGKRK